MTPTTPAKPALRFFRREELEPGHPDPTTEHPDPIPLSPAEKTQLDEFCRTFSRTGEFEFEQAPGQIPGHLRMFVSMLAALGVVRLARRAGGVRVRQSGRLAKHVPQILTIYLDRSYALIDDWDRSSLLHEDRLNAVNFVHQLELRRIELERRSGKFPEILAERPVAFGVFRAIDDHGRSSYLFEVNKDWHRLNLIGGKQEPQDNGDYHVTLQREISEELGISPARVTLTQLNEDPLVGYSLSGNAGSLARYPCILFDVIVDGAFGTRPQDRWITEDTIRKYLDVPDCPIMVNPVYLRFLLSGSPTRLERCPLTTSTVVRSAEPDGIGNLRKEEIGRRVARYARDNKELLAAILTLVAALITVIVAF